MAKEAAVAIEELLSQSTSALNLSQLASGLLKELGGMEEFTKEWVIAYKATKPGSTARTKMLQDMFKIIQMAAPKGAGGDLGHLTEDELQKLLKTLVDKAGITGQASPPADQHGTDTERPTPI